MNGLLWYGYIHVNGQVFVKRYFDQGDLDEARESDFVQQVIGPFIAESREQAIEAIKQNLKM